MPASRISEFWSGIKAEIPLLIGVFPFGVIYGVLALEAGLLPLQAQAMSVIIFAGSAQFLTTQMVEMSIPGAVMVFTVGIINLRHALYSASLAPYVRKLSPFWKIILAYLLTDEAYAVTITHYEHKEEHGNKHWFFLGAGIALWTIWQISTAVGISLGEVIPASWSLDFTLTLTFIAIVVPKLTDRPSLIAALVAGLLALLGYSLPHRLGLVLAALAGILAGALVERKT